MKATPHPEPCLSIQTLQHAANVLRVLAHPHRLKIVDLLMDQNLTVGQLAQSLDLAPNAVSQHLNHMRAHGILEAQRDGRSVFYHVINPNALNVIQCIRRHNQDDRQD